MAELKSELKYLPERDMVCYLDVANRLGLMVDG
jgi:hypothetical protein